MKVTVTVDEYLRLIIPSGLHARLNLKPGASLVLELPEAVDSKPSRSELAKFNAALDSFSEAAPAPPANNTYDSLDHTFRPKS